MRGAQIRDAWRLLCTISPSKAWNYCLVQHSSQWSRWMKRPVLLGFPAFVHIEPTNHCNLSCPECPTGAGLLTRTKGNIAIEKYRSLLEKLSSTAFYLNLYFQGEPLLHQDFPKLVALAKKEKFYVVSSTNAQLLTADLAIQLVQSGLDRIIISFDGPDEATYSNYRKGGTWDQVLNAVRFLVEAKATHRSATPLIVLQCLLFRSNEDKKTEVRTLAQSLGADKLEFKTLQLLDCSKESALLPKQTANRRYAQKSQGGYDLITKRRRACHNIFNSCVITWDGEVLPCCYDKNAHHSFGNIYCNSLAEIWKGDRRKTFIQKILTRQQSIEMCQGCED
jgi:radical SAM protein with 4Fe4S-binding SPASM domain